MFVRTFVVPSARVGFDPQEAILLTQELLQKQVVAGSIRWSWEPSFSLARCGQTGTNGPSVLHVVICLL